MEIVEDEDDAPRHHDQLVDQQRDDDVLEARARRADRSFGPRADPGRHPPERLDHARPETHPVVVGLVERQPGERLLHGCRTVPLLQQRRLA